MIDDNSEPASTTALRADHLTGMQGRLAAPCLKLPTTQSPLNPATALLQIYPAGSTATELAKARQIHPTYGATLEASRKSENRKATRTATFFAMVGVSQRGIPRVTSTKSQATSMDSSS